MSPPPHLQSFPATLGQRAKGVPLVADLLAAGVDIVGVIVVQLTARGGGAVCSGREGRHVAMRPGREQGKGQRGGELLTHGETWLS